jgi:iron complex outermembrane receptor protein
MKASLLTLFCLFLIASNIFSQESYVLSGTVCAPNGDPLSGATIAIEKLQLGSIADKNGFFTLNSIPKGTYILQASFIGFVSVNDTIDLKKNKAVSIVLHQNSVNLNEIVVRENYENSRNKKEALSIEVVKADFILENNAGNLIKTLEQLPGVYSMDIGSGFSKPVIRGMGFNRVAVSENGIKQEGQQWGADHGLELDQFNVEKVVVYKGPMSLQYGSDAIGGLIEISRAVPPVENKFFGEVVSIAKSNNNLLGASVMVGLKQNNWFFKSRWTEQHFGDYKVPTDSFVYLTRPMPIYNGKLKNTAGYERDVTSSIGYTNAKFNTFFTVSNVYQKIGFFPGSHGVPDIKRLMDDGNDRNVEFPYSQVNHFKLINNTVLKLNTWKASVDLAFQNNQRQEWAKFHTHYGNQPLPLTNPDLELEFNLRTYSGNIKLESQNDSLWHHSIGVNSDFQQNNIDGYVFLLPEYKRFTTGVYAIESYKLNEKMKITGGLRFDFGNIAINGFQDAILEQYLQNMNIYTPAEIAFYSQRSYGINKNYFNTSWSLGWVYNRNLNETYKANIGRSFRLPGANELGSNGVHHGTFRHEQGDTALLSEKGYQMDIAYTFSNDLFYLSINPFVSWFSNYIYLNPTGVWSVLPHAGQIYKYTQAEAVVGGGEVTLNYEFHENFTYETSLEYVYMQNLTDGYPLPFSPPLSLLNSLTWHWHSENANVEEFHFKVEHQYVAGQNRIARNEDISKGYSLFGLSINNNMHFGKTKLNVSFQIQNLLNTKYYNHLSYYRKLNIPEAGRNIQLILKFPFQN